MSLCRLALFALVSLQVGCLLPATANEPPDGPPLTRKVLVVGMDGVRPDALLAARTPHLDQLSEAGTWSETAQTQLQADTVSGPGWASILTGVDSGKHGIVGNAGYQGRSEKFPTMFWRARNTVAASTALAVHWTPVALMVESEVLDASLAGNDEQVATGMAELLTAGDHDLHFVHLDDVDGAGHSTGFSPTNKNYLEAIEANDTHVGLLVEALEARPGYADEEWMIIITTDHGGQGTGHGPRTPVCRTIPMIVQSSQHHGGLRTGGSHLDVAPTALSWLGADPDPSWGLDGEVWRE